MLSLTLGNALSGLKASQQALAVISQNVANANNADYSRQVITQESVALGGQVGNGVRTKDVIRAVDEFIARSVTNRNSDVAQTSTIKDYYNQVQQYFGQPGASNSIDTYLNTYFTNLNTLQSNPKDGSVKLATVSAAQTAASQISQLAYNIEDTRFQADQAISKSVDNINSLVKQLQGYNVALINAQKNNASPASLLDSVQATLNKLSTEIDIKYQFQPDGTVSVSGGGGYNLLNGSSRYELSYKPALSADDFVNKATTNELQLYSVDQAGNRADQPTATIANAGVGSQIKSTITSGNLKGLMQVRDTLLPNMLDQLNNLAANLRDQMNSIHNQGSSFPPAASLTGETLIDPAKPRAWSGNIMIAALNADGTPITSSYLSDQGKGTPPLTLNLGALNDGHGNGQVTTQTIIDEINNYYGAPQARVNLGPLSDIKLAATSDSLNGSSGIFGFNLDLSNFSSGDAKVVVTGATVNNGAAFTIPATFPSAAYTVTAGTESRGIDFKLDMSSGTATNYTVSLNVQVTAVDGTVKNDIISYNINAATSDLMNKRYSATSVSGSGDAIKENPTTLNPTVTATLVDANGKEIKKDPLTGNYLAPGYLKIQGNGNTKIALSEMNSKDLGYYNLNGTGQGFSHTLGLNNFFTSDGSSSNDNAAYNLAVRPDIVATPTLIATGELAPSSTDPVATANYGYELGESSTSIVQKMGNMNLKNQNFAGAGTLPPISVTFSGYAAQILGYVGSKTAEATTNATQAEQIYNGFADRDKNERGVNVDEELANTIIYQNAYAASARVISVVGKLFDDLLATFN